MSTPSRPSPGLVSKYVEMWHKSEKMENYRLQEASLFLLFQQMWPENTKFEHVLLKVTALNAFYSTNIYDTFSVAKHILAIDVDARLDADDCSLVNDIANVTIKGKTKNFYSFASKFCSHHKPTSYPIFDSFVEKLMLYYKREDSFYDFNAADLKDYKRFVEVIRRFQSFYKLEKHSLREIDMFLWMAGKEWFPRKYY